MQLSKWSIVSSLVLLMALPVRGEGLSHKKQKEPVVDSLVIFVEKGDSCMQDYNTFEALQHYQKAYDIAVAQDSIPRDVRLKLADCYYKRANYREAADLLKLMPEDSLTHQAFRQLAYSYQKQGDIDSFIYWAELLVDRFPKDGEVVAGLINALSQNNQPHKGLKYGSTYSLHDMHNILVNRAMADAFFLDRNFTAALVWYQHLIEEGDSTFNAFYSAGMCYSQIEDLERAYSYLRDALVLSQMRHYGAAYRLGVVCIDTKRYEEGLGYLELARELMRPDTTVMKAITLAQGEGYYLTQHYDKALEVWKEHLAYNPTSVATYYNIANIYAYVRKEKEKAKDYYLKFLEKAREVEKPTPQLEEMTKKAQEFLK
ncbi:MAG: hypothetical protein IJ159_06200 [Prevotella sp.]|nr:hypothetical protein [Prevotella sp.]